MGVIIKRRCANFGTAHGVSDFWGVLFDGDLGGGAVGASYDVDAGGCRIAYLRAIKIIDTDNLAFIYIVFAYSVNAYGCRVDADRVNLDAVA